MPPTLFTARIINHLDSSLSSHKFHTGTEHKRDTKGHLPLCCTKPHRHTERGLKPIIRHVKMIHESDRGICMWAIEYNSGAGLWAQDRGAHVFRRALKVLSYTRALELGRASNRFGWLAIGHWRESAWQRAAHSYERPTEERRQACAIRCKGPSAGRALLCSTLCASRNWRISLRG